MIIIKRFFVDEEKLKLKMAERKAKATNTDGTRKKSKFQEKLEEMQRKQQEMLKNKKR
jgi:YidC/Oxa1 family membrane protein insertase